MRQLLKRSEEGRVVATCRNPDGAADLLKLKKEYENRLNILPLDVTNETTIEVYVSSFHQRHILASLFAIAIESADVSLFFFNMDRYL